MVIVFNKLIVDIVWFVRLNEKKVTKNTQKINEKVFFWQKILIYVKCNAVKSEIFSFGANDAPSKTSHFYEDLCCNA